MHICEASETGSKIFAKRIPIHPETIKLADQLRISPMVAALSGGEDYEILFTISPEDSIPIQSIEGVTVIGVMTDKSDGHLIELKDKSTILMEAQGWNAGEKWGNKQ
jgi:thiamine-monophosphate kinase